MLIEGSCGVSNEAANHRTYNVKLYNLLAEGFTLHFLNDAEKHQSRVQPGEVGASNQPRSEATNHA